MTQTQLTDPYFRNDVCAIVVEERKKALSVREWKHRLAGYGLFIEQGLVKTLRQGAIICPLPAELA